MCLTWLCNQVSKEESESAFAGEILVGGGAGFWNGGVLGFKKSAEPLGITLADLPLLRCVAKKDVVEFLEFFGSVWFFGEEACCEKVFCEVCGEIVLL